MAQYQRESGQVYCKKENIASNKLQDFETVSQGSRHRSNHTQKNIPSVVAGHQFLQSGYIGPDTGIFPITENVIHPGFCLRKDSTFQQILFSPNCLFGICCLPLASSSCKSSSSFFRRHTKASLVMLLETIHEHPTFTFQWEHGNSQSFQARVTSEKLQASSQLLADVGC